jgi:hypothetical protein
VLTGCMAPSLLGLTCMKSGWYADIEALEAAQSSKLLTSSRVVGREQEVIAWGPRGLPPLVPNDATGFVVDIGQGARTQCPARTAGSYACEWPYPVKRFVCCGYRPREGSRVLLAEP